MIKIDNNQYSEVALLTETFFGLLIPEEVAGRIRKTTKTVSSPFTVYSQNIFFFLKDF